MPEVTSLIHPAYFGNIALWSVIVKAEDLRIERCDNYQKQTYRNRLYIAHSNGKLGLNIPIRHSKKGERQKTATVTIENNFHWQRDHWRSLEAGYRSSPFFEFYEDELEPFFKERKEILFENNLQSMELIADLIGIPFEYSFTEQYDLETPPGTKDYRPLIRSKKVPEITTPHYHQVHEVAHGYLNNLSVLDLLFNLGPESISYLEKLEL
ncbi:WbqC family protein [Gilvibacter sediminis]|uniref:WbqC family protein n=1 Tax=Gilvibacter sediminis TaxID=379071 RepID=UPI00234FC47B|nr:WbqC family protein [Gilvibacter sediminis]MDC7998918.1 WbqC family protein [Gilvibacter sediminis]